MTTLGYIFTAAVAATLLLRRPALVAVAILAAVFQAGAVVNYTTGSGAVIPVMPYYFVCVAIACALVLEARRVVRGWSEASPSARRQLRWLVFFCAWGVASAFLLPHYFAGLLVNTPRGGLDASYFQLLPLRFSNSNLAQATYLPLNLCLLVFAVGIRARRSMSTLLNRAFAASVAVVLAAGFYQKAASIFHWPYQASFLVSNIVSYNTYAWAEVSGGLGLRLSAPFSEASYAGAFLAPTFLFFLVYAARSRRHRGRRMLVATLCLAALALTGSSTGYVAALAGLTLFGSMELVAPLARGRLRPTTAAAAGGVVLALAAGFALLPLESVQGVLNGALLQKLASGSALHRFAADGVAWSLFLHTAGLGVGLGSERPSSFVPCLLSNVGVIGAAAFLGALVQLLLAARQRQRAIVEPEEGSRFLALRYAFAVNLVALAVSIPDLSWQMIWVWWAMLLVEIAAPQLQDRTLPPRGASERAAWAAGWAPTPVAAGWRN